eukprot:ctg_1766.g536
MPTRPNGHSGRCRTWGIAAPPPGTCLAEVHTRQYGRKSAQRILMTSMQRRRLSFIQAWMRLAVWRTPSSVAPTLGRCRRRPVGRSVSPAFAQRRRLSLLARGTQGSDANVHAPTSPHSTPDPLIRLSSTPLECLRYAERVLFAEVPEPRLSAEHLLTAAVNQVMTPALADAARAATEGVAAAAARAAQCVAGGVADASHRPKRRGHRRKCRWCRPNHCASHSAGASGVFAAVCSTTTTRAGAIPVWRLGVSPPHSENAGAGVDTATGDGRAGDARSAMLGHAQPPRPAARSTAARTGRWLR